MKEHEKMQHSRRDKNIQTKTFQRAESHRQAKPRYSQLHILICSPNYKMYQETTNLIFHLASMALLKVKHLHVRITGGKPQEEEW